MTIKTTVPSDKSFRSRVLLNGLYVGISRLVRSASPILLTPLYLHAWGSELFGDWLAISAFASSLLLLQDGGVSMSLANAMGMLERDKSEEASRLQKLAIVFAGLIGVLIVMAGLGLLLVIEAFVDLSTLNPFDLRFIFLIQLATSCSSLAIGSLVGSYRFAEDERAFLRIGGMASFLELLLVGSALMSLASPVTVCLLICSVRAGQLIVVFIGSKKRLRSVSSSPVRISEYRPYLKSSAGFALLPVTVTLQNQISLLLVHQFFGASMASLFQVTKTYANSVQLASGIIYSATLPELPKLWARGETRCIGRIYKTAILATLTVTVVLAGILYLAGPFIFRIWTGGRIEFAATLSIAVIGSACATSLLNSAMAIPRATNRVYEVSVLMLGLNVISLGAIYFYHSTLGISGAATAILVAEVISFYLVLRMSYCVLAEVENKPAMESLTATATAA